MAGGPFQAPAPAGTPPAGPGWAVPPPAPKRKGAGAGTVVLVVAILAAVVGAVAFAGLRIVDASQERDEQREQDLTDRRAEADRDREEAGDVATSTTAPAPAPPTRQVVDAGGGLSWTMRGDVSSEPVDLASPAGPIEATVWYGELGSDEADVAFVFDLEGRSFSPDDGLRQAVSSTGGTIVSGPSDVVVAGRPGRMVVASVSFGGEAGALRYAVVQFDDRILILGVSLVGEVADGEQAFADLVASVSYS